MSKKSVPASNDFCPQTLFLYGTYKQDGTPNFGLFCWFSYCWDGELCVMASIGGEKTTKDNIRRTGMFSANLVTESILPLADYYGNKSGYDADKMAVLPETLAGAVLHVPVLKDSPLCFELEVKKTIPLDDSDVFLCKVRNVMVDETLANRQQSMEALLHEIGPVATTCETYFSFDGRKLGAWGELKDKV
jgi:flavin reductase (DIM6/NTAB) family NADH-FMN oxidoreductase RutF